MSILDKVSSIKTVLSVIEGIMKVLIKCLEVIQEKVDGTEPTL